jgi:hypothetical protein
MTEKWKSKEARMVDTKTCHRNGCTTRVRPEDGWDEDHRERWPESMRQVCAEHTPQDD